MLFAIQQPVIKKKKKKSLFVNSLNLETPIVDPHRLYLIHWFQAWFIAIYNEMLDSSKLLAVSQNTYK